MTDAAFSLLSIAFMVAVCVALYGTRKQVKQLEEALEYERKCRKDDKNAHWELRKMIRDLEEYLDVEHANYSGSRYEKRKARK